MSMRLLDLFCGAGGAAMGYHLAGFEVIGVDIAPQPDYPFEFHQADALTFPLDGFDVIHASPPCQGYCTVDRLNSARGWPSRKARLVEPVRDRLLSAGTPYVIENVPGAPLRNAVQLCGSSFGIGVRRHRIFEVTPLPALAPPCAHGHQRDFVGVYGDHPGGTLGGDDGYVRQPRAASTAQAQDAMGITWTGWAGLREAIPPAYTHWLGTHLVEALDLSAAGRLHVLAAQSLTGGAGGSRPKSEACLDAPVEPVTLPGRRGDARPTHGDAA
jgi:hypothetical protein